MPEPVRIIYAGTPDFAVPPLQALQAAGYNVVAVYTQPDRPAGRGREPKASAVKQAALELNIAVLQPERLSSAQDQQQLQALQPDLMIVTAYGLLLPQTVLEIPRLGCINIHASLLPRWRGAAPIQRAIIAGDKTTGITIMQMDAGLDTGAMLASAECDIRDDDTGSSLHDRLMQLGADTLIACLPDLLAGKLSPQQQDDTASCYAKKLSKREAQLDWQQDAATLQRCVRAFNAWPVAYTLWHKDGVPEDQPQMLRVWQAEVLSRDSDADPGTVIRCSKDGIDVACARGVLRLLEVQPAGKRKMPVADFVNAHDLTGHRLLQ
jgi:methionyl-tRNA formyltransferase